MGKKQTIDSDFWISEYIESLTIKQRYLFLYLITNNYAQITGIYRIPLKTIIAETDLTKSEVISYLKKFEADNCIMYRDTWLCIKKRNEFNKKDNENQKKAYIKAIDESPDFIRDFISLSKSIEVFESSPELHINTNTNINNNTNKDKNNNKNENFEKIKEFWNSKDYLKKVREITPDREKKLKTLSKEKAFIDNYEIMINRLEFSSFCNGDNDRAWKANFDWFLYCDNKITYIKILEFNSGLFTDQDIEKYSQSLINKIMGDPDKIKRLKDAGYTKFEKEFSQPHQLEKILYTDDFNISDIIAEG